MLSCRWVPCGLSQRWIHCGLSWRWVPHGLIDLDMDILYLKVDILWVGILVLDESWKPLDVDHYPFEKDLFFPVFHATL